uniref:Uncharacterized protein LOC104215961 n=1 Tax=Nicotiana sylvestris TaxID=4096 RepID=A0A1U7VPC5_NICSY|nr:PREDICTED: uncharacterized protein LOC104215961 [Nicotiana sylvestris]
MSDRVHPFMNGLGPHLINECTIASLVEGMDISRIQAYAQTLKDHKCQQRANKEQDRGQNKRAKFSEYSDDFRGQCSRASGSQYHKETSQMRPPTPRCDQCGKAYFGLCHRGYDACYFCGQPGHMIWDCPNRGGGGMAQPTRSMYGSSSSV